MLAFLVVICLFSIFYTYFGYPICLWVINNFFPRRVERDFPAPEKAPAVAIIITVRNEAKVIETKLNETLELQYGGVSIRENLARGSNLIEVIVASDASDDGTDEVVTAFSSQGVRLVRLAERGGKERAQREAIDRSESDLIVFTDAKIKLNEKAIDNFVKYFRDDSVGAVSSVDEVVADDGSSSGEGFYVRYEMWLRSQESKFNSLVGLSGSCFAVRRSVAENIRTDIPSDFALLIEAQRQGLRGVHAPDVVGSYKAVRTEKEEFSRKVRTVLRGITAFFAERKIIDFSKHGLFSWQLISHKLLRWLVPWTMLIAFFGSSSLASYSGFFMLVFLGMTGFFGAAIWAWIDPKKQKQLIFKIPLFFCVVNLGIGSAWLKFISGHRSVAWTPSDKGK